MRLSINLGNVYVSLDGQATTVLTIRRTKRSVILVVTAVQAQVPTIVSHASSMPQNLLRVNVYASPIGLVMTVLYISHIHIRVMQNVLALVLDLPHLIVYHAYSMPPRTIRVSVFVIKDGKVRTALTFQVVDVLQNVRLALVLEQMNVQVV